MSDAKPLTPDDLKNPAGWQAPLLTDDALLADAREQLLRVVYLVRLHDAPDWTAVAETCETVAARIQRRQEVGYE